MSKTANKTSHSQNNDFNVDWWALRLSNRDVVDPSDQFVIVAEEDSVGAPRKVCSQTYAGMNQFIDDDVTDLITGAALDLPQTNVSRYMLQNLKTFGKDPATVDKAIFALVHRIDENLKTGQVLSSKRRDGR